MEDDVTQDHVEEGYESPNGEVPTEKVRELWEVRGSTEATDSEYRVGGGDIPHSWDGNISKSIWADCGRMHLFWVC